MIRKDIVLRWTQELAKVVAKLMGKETKEALGIIEEAYNGLLRIDPKEFDQLPNEQIIHFLTQEKKLSLEQLEFMASLLAKEGELTLELGEIARGKSKLEKALIIFGHVESQQELFSFERQATIDTIKLLLDK